MKILAICGSPRKGNTEFMLRKVLESAEKNNAETELILLKDKNIKLCIACDLCFKEGKPCHIDDDFKAMRDKIVSSDILLLGCPNYFKNVSTLMKMFIDRTDEFLFHKELRKLRVPLWWVLELL